MRSIIAMFVVLAASLKAMAEPKPDPKEQQAATEIKRLTRAAEMYKLRHNKYPATLKDLVDAKYVEAKFDNLKDPWGNVFRYDAAGPRNKGERPDISAETPDKKMIKNWPDAQED